MSDLFNMRERYEDDAQFHAVQLSDMPTSYGEGVKASFDQLFREETSISSNRNHWKTVKERASVIGSLGGDEELASIYGTAMHPDHMDRLRELEMQKSLEGSAEWYATPNHVKASFLHVRQMEKLYPDKVKSDAAMREERNRKFAELRPVEDETMQRAHWSASFVGAMGVVMTDPLVLMSLPFGGTIRAAGSTALGTAARFAGAEAAIAGATEVPIQALVYQYKRELDAPWSVSMAAMNILAASAGGAVFGGLIGGVGQAGKNYLEPKRILKATEEMRRRIEDGSIILTREELDALSTVETAARIDALNPLVDRGAARITTGQVEGVPDFANATEAYHFALEVSRMQHEAGLPVDVEDIVGEYLDFYHGSGAEFVEFDLTHIGSGEGAQAFGWGGYLAEVKDTGVSYKDSVSAYKITLDGVQIDPLNPPDDLTQLMRRIYSDPQRSGLKGAREAAEGQIETYKGIEGAEEIINEEQAILDTIAKYGDRLKDSESYLYKVRIAKSDVDKMLDWDKPINKQSEGVRKALKPMIDYMHTRPLSDQWKKRLDLGDITGKELYDNYAGEIALEKNINVIGNNAEAQKLTSEFLNNAGIPGIKYLDGTSRKAGEGTRNIVFFDPRIVDIVERNGVPIESPVKAQAKLKTGDIFGDDTRSAQALADEIRRKDALRNTGQDSLETGDPSDLFSQAKNQIDLEDATKENIKPAKIDYFDQRLNREFYRREIEGMGNDLTEGGGIALVPSKELGETFSHRTKSINPEWFKAMNEVDGLQMTVKKVRRAIELALAGKKLGVRQQRVIEYMLDDILARRENDVPAAKQQLEEQRAIRKEQRKRDDDFYGEPPRSIVKKNADPDDANTYSRTGIISDDDYKMVLDEYEDILNQYDLDDIHIAQDQEGELVVRKASDVMEELETLDKTFNDIRVCSIGGTS